MTESDCQLVQNQDCKSRASQTVVASSPLSHTGSQLHKAKSQHPTQTAELVLLQPGRVSQSLEVLFNPGDADASGLGTMLGEPLL